MPPDKPDVTELVRIFTELVEIRRRFAQEYLVRPPKLSQPGTCPEDLDEMCKALNEWFAWFYAWAAKVENKLPGGPGDLPPPPPPPFG